MVVEVALGVEDGVACGEDSGRQLLGRRLAIGTRDGEDGRPQLPSVVGGQLLQTHKDILHEERALVDELLGIVQHGVGRPRLERLARVAVAVEVRPLEGKEDTARAEAPRIGRYRRVLEIELIEIVQ